MLDFGVTAFVSILLLVDPPGCVPVILAGGGIRGGQVIGATDRLGGKVIARPVSYQEVFASLYQYLGIAAGRTPLLDPTGHPKTYTTAKNPEIVKQLKAKLEKWNATLPKVYTKSDDKY